MAKKLDLSKVDGSIDVKFFDKYLMSDRERYLWLMKRIMAPSFAKMPHAYRSAAIEAASDSLRRWNNAMSDEAKKAETIARKDMRNIEHGNFIRGVRVAAIARNNKRLKIKAR